ncbi:uncharacterized protein A1O5_04065 [Cladophialophora psammophila CBS 110553]|uniref:Uncharacterized protein n=1 Tax=Cladophialophora psammophila CBS 110553 TaxID=1182543 RepID=W9WXJ1_9EURO|nr:uncharacterized protein A1O5_04065 [Cladophialophora psammophila CBS 110553]EXJ72917.1 hypothetical protein A1O5_04065 [Cladophialophora psammophila CBS 110553]
MKSDLLLISCLVAPVAAAGSVCSSGIYGLLAPLSGYAPAQSYCSSHYPPSTVVTTVTLVSSAPVKVKRYAKTTTTKTTTAKSTTTSTKSPSTTSTKPSTTSVDPKAALFSTLLSEAENNNTDDDDDDDDDDDNNNNYNNYNNYNYNYNDIHDSNDYPRDNDHNYNNGKDKSSALSYEHQS